MPVDSVSDKWLKPVAGSPFGKTLEFARSVASIVPTVAIATLPLVLEMAVPRSLRVTDQGVLVVS